MRGGGEGRKERSTITHRPDQGLVEMSEVWWSLWSLQARTTRELLLFLLSVAPCQLSLPGISNHQQCPQCPHQPLANQKDKKNQVQYCSRFAYPLRYGESTIYSGTPPNLKKNTSFNNIFCPISVWIRGVELQSFWYTK